MSSLNDKITNSVKETIQCTRTQKALEDIDKRIKPICKTIESLNKMLESIRKELEEQKHLISLIENEINRNNKNG